MSGNDRELVSMEEGRKEKNGIKEEVGETSQDSEQIIEKSKKLSIKAEENLRSLDNLLIDLKAGDQEPTTKPLIPKVPQMMRDYKDLDQYFKPRMLSIGPYHHENQNLKVTQQMKLKVAAIFIKENGVNKEDLYFDISTEIKDLRNCYESDATNCYDDDELAWMFLIDGCVVLHSLYVAKQVRERKNMLKSYEILKSKGLEFIQAFSDDIKFAMDLLFLENQLPYKVLKLVINSSENSERLMISIQEYITLVTYSGLEDKMQLPREDPLHLLDLMRAGLIQSSGKKKSSSTAWIICQYKIKFMDMLHGILQSLITVLLHILPFRHAFNLRNFRNIMELKERGIKLKCSRTCYLTDVSFSGGTLTLPSIVVNQLTLFKFFNLVAYEMCMDSSDNELKVSAYVYFLASLIAEVEDVKELNSKGILYNFLDKDEEVVKIFQELRTDDMFMPFAKNYFGILEEIHEYCSKEYNAWIVQLKNKYFDSPWSMIALAGATIAISVTILQTVYTVLAYYATVSK